MLEQPGDGGLRRLPVFVVQRRTRQARRRPPVAPRGPPRRRPFPARVRAACPAPDRTIPRLPPTAPANQADGRQNPIRENAPPACSPRRIARARLPAAPAPAAPAESPSPPIRHAPAGTRVAPRPRGRWPRPHAFAPRYPRVPIPAHRRRIDPLSSSSSSPPP